MSAPGGAHEAGAIPSGDFFVPANAATAAQDFFAAEWRPVNGGPAASEVDAARRYGITLHALLEALAAPATPLGRAELFARSSSPQDEFARAWQQAVGIINAPGLARFFKPDRYLRAHNELPFYDDAGQLRRIDRLVEFDEEIWLIDYKAMHAARHDSELVERYAAQVSTYRDAMARIFTKPVHCGLILGDASLIELR